jgi:hypothetical protein
MPLGYSTLCTRENPTNGGHALSNYPLINYIIKRSNYLINQLLGSVNRHTHCADQFLSCDRQSPAQPFTLWQHLIYFDLVTYLMSYFQ